MKFSSGLNVAIKLILATIFSATAALANFSIEDSQIFHTRYFLKGNAMMKAVTTVQATACQPTDRGILQPDMWRRI